jgi:hypothetical protein
MFYIRTSLSYIHRNTCCDSMHFYRRVLVAGVVDGRLLVYIYREHTHIDLYQTH